MNQTSFDLVAGLLKEADKVVFHSLCLSHFLLKFTEHLRVNILNHLDELLVRIFSLFLLSLQGVHMVCQHLLHLSLGLLIGLLPLIWFLGHNITKSVDTVPEVTLIFICGILSSFPLPSKSKHNWLLQSLKDLLLDSIVRFSPMLFVPGKKNLKIVFT